MLDSIRICTDNWNYNLRAMKHGAVDCSVWTLQFITSNWSLFIPAKPGRLSNGRWRNDVAVWRSSLWWLFLLGAYNSLHTRRMPRWCPPLKFIKGCSRCPRRCSRCPNWTGNFTRIWRSRWPIIWPRWPRILRNMDNFYVYWCPCLELERVVGM